MVGKAGVLLSRRRVFSMKSAQQQRIPEKRHKLLDVDPHSEVSQKQCAAPKRLSATNAATTK